MLAQRKDLMSSTAMTPPSAQAGMAGGGEPPDQQGNVSPEEQESYNLFVGRALQLAGQPKVKQGLMQRIKATDPIDGLASATIMVIDRTREAAQKAGTEISDDVLFVGGAEIMQVIAAGAAREGVHEFTPKEIEAAGYRAMDQWREAHQGELDQGQVQQAFSDMMGMQENGELQQLLGGGAPAGAQPAASPAPAMPARKGMVR